MISHQTILVFGGAGFIGSHLLRRLAREGTNRLYAIDIVTPRLKVEGVTYINRDIRDLSDFDLPETPDIIFNLAAVHTTPGHPTHEYYETNIRGATEVTAFARRKGVARLVFTSSISVYGPSEETKSEATKVAPESAYGWSKWLAEGIHQAWREENPTRRLVICRPAVIFGYKEDGNFVRMAKLLRKGFFIYPGRKDTIKACFYVEDLIDALFYADGLAQPYVLFNGAYPDRYTIEDIVQALKGQAFPSAKEMMVPKAVVLGIANLLRPFTALGLGVHPDRVLKLIRSTDVVPGWLEAHGQAKRGGLANALSHWHEDSAARFD